MKKIILLFIIFALPQISHAGSLKFIKNEGQWTNPTQFKANIDNGALFLTSNSVVYNFMANNNSELSQKYMAAKQVGIIENNVPKAPLIDMHAFAINFLGANTNIKAEGLNQNKLTENYFLGKNAANWKKNVRSYNKVRYNNIYDGIDLEYFTTTNNLKYEFLVAAGTDPNNIQLQLEGSSAEIDKDGNLIIETSVGNKKEMKPVSFQNVDGKIVMIETEFKLIDNIISFTFPNGYDKTKELIIDPVLDFATYSGSTVQSRVFSMNYDALGQSHFAGVCDNIGYPTTLGSYQQTLGGTFDVVLGAYDITGANLLYTTYLGGSGFDFAPSVTIGTNNNIIVAGSTESVNFPTTAGAYSTAYNQGGAAGTNSSDIFVSVFDNAGSTLLHSTFVSSQGGDANLTTMVQYDSNNHHIVVASTSFGANFPVTQGVFQPINGGLQDVVVFKLDSSCANLIASTLIGGYSLDAPTDLFVEPNGNVLVTGCTLSGDFPTTAGVLTPTMANTLAFDAFAVKLNSDFTSLIASTFIGTNSDECGNHIMSDANGDIYVCGTSDASLSAVTPGAYSNPTGRIFLQKYDSNLSTLLAATQIGNLTAPTPLPLPFPLFPLINNALPFAFNVDSCDNVFVGLYTDPTLAQGSLPTTSNAYQTTPSNLSWCELGPNFSNLLYGSYIGTIADSTYHHCGQFDVINNKFYLATTTGSTNYYQSPGCYQPTNLSTTDIALAKISLDPKVISAEFSWNTSTPDTVCLNDTIFFSPATGNGTSYNWDFGDNTTSNLNSPSHMYTQTGQYTVRLIITGNATGGCSGAGIDTVTKLITVLEGAPPILSVQDDTLCSTNNTPIEVLITNFNPNASYTYNWTPAAGIVSGGNTTNPTVNPNISTTYNVEITTSSVGFCPSSSNASINILVGDTSAMQVSPADIGICEGASTTLTASGGLDYLWLVDNSTNPTRTVSPANDTRYQVQITDAFGCSATKSANVRVEKVNANAGPDKFVKKGSQVNLEGSVNQGNTFFWLPNPTLLDVNDLNTSVNPQAATEYTLVAETQSGCKDSDKVVVNIANFNVPNAFSPNGDNLNDLFRINPLSDNIVLKDLSVFNRWGMNIFKTNNINKAWDGTYQGQNCEIGTYFYLIKISIGDEDQTLRGDVTLIR